MITESVRAVLISGAMLGLQDANGVEPLTEVPLDADTMHSLGFSLNVIQEDGFRLAQLSGPAEVDGCPARRAGSYLLNLSGELIAFQSAWFQANDGTIGPVAEISFDGDSPDARLFIDYVCAGSANGNRYVLELPMSSEEAQ